MIDKIKLAYQLFNTNTYILMTDKISVMSMPLVDVDAFSNTVLLSGQNYALHEMRNRIDEVIREHDIAIENLHRQKRLREEELKESSSENNTKRGSKRNTK